VGTGLVLQTAAGDTLTIAPPTEPNTMQSIVFPSSIASGASYRVAVSAQPSTPTQTCLIANDSGVVGAGNVVDVSVTCTTNTYAAGFTVTGLAPGQTLNVGVPWGDDGSDIQITADGTYTSPTPIASGGGFRITYFTDPASTTDHSCTLSTDLVLVTDAPAYASFVCIPRPTSYVSLATGLSETDNECAIASDGSLWCWGSDQEGEVGVYGRQEFFVPVHVGSSTSWTSVSVGDEFVCGLQTDTSLWCWGRDTLGRFGDGANDGSSSVPARLGTDSWRAIDASGGGACGIHADGTLWCWGLSLLYQLETTMNDLGPTQFASGMTWTSLSVGATSACAIATNGSLWCWGRNDEGQLGNGSMVGGGEGTVPPTEVASPLPWSSVSVGDDESVCAIRVDGSLWCWGVNNGFLGDGTTAPNQLSPEQIRGSSTWRSIDVGDNNLCGVQVDGSRWCWGENVSGDIGDGTTTARSSPELIGSAHWLSFSGRQNHIYGLQSDGSLWVSGAVETGFNAPVSDLTPAAFP
jgi:alpha-tubulin suppressor-like RCC1 family protein